MNFVESNRKENIFYGDIFVINQIGALVFGHGKSKVCGNLTGQNTERIALDMACLTEECGKLYGHFEMDLRAQAIPDPIKDKVEIKHFLRMLSEEETKLNNVKKPIEISVDNFIDMCEFNITFSISEVFVPVKNDYKMNVFRDLIDGKILKCYVIPWCDTPEERGNLIKAYVTADL
jgi:hypothetical protein